jgi:DNA-binding FadR family transcriptional regulator
VDQRKKNAGRWSTAVETMAAMDHNATGVDVLVSTAPSKPPVASACEVVGEKIPTLTRRAEPRGPTAADDGSFDLQVHNRMLRILALEILDGRYDATGLPSDVALQRRFRVSRSRLRDVMRDLVAKGFLTAEMRIVAVPAETPRPFDPDALQGREAGENPVFGEDLRAMCLGLECEAARRAARRRSSADLAILQQCLADLAADPSSLAARTIQRVFRLTICAVLGRSVARFASGLIEAQPMLDAPWGQETIAARSKAMQRVFLAIRDGDEAAAAAAMRGVIG